MISEDKIIVALDTSSEAQLLKLFEELREKKVWVKVGMELFYAQGPIVLELAKQNDFKIFLDLKLHDIPNTVGAALKALSRLPFDMINVHAAGGSEMMKRASEVIHSLPQRPLLIAVTQLTSTSQEAMNREQRISGDLLESVTHYAKLAQESGCDGVVCSPHEASAVKLICGSRFLTVTPGIRPKDASLNDQIRITTPLEAIQKGADYLVIGRPITQAQKPREALELILKGN